MLLIMHISIIYEELQYRRLLLLKHWWHDKNHTYRNILLRLVVKTQKNMRRVFKPIR